MLIHTCNYCNYATVYTVPLKCNFTHVRMYWLVHMRAQTCIITSDDTLTSLTYFTRMLHKGLHTHVWCSSAYITRVVLECIHTHVILACHLRVVERALEG